MFVTTVEMPAQYALQPASRLFTIALPGGSRIVDLAPIAPVDNERTRSLGQVRLVVHLPDNYQSATVHEHRLMVCGDLQRFPDNSRRIGTYAWTPEEFRHVYELS